MKKKQEEDIKGVVSREGRYATLAKKEGDYAMKQIPKEKAKGMKEMAKDSKHEAKVAYMFAKKRKSIAAKESRKLRK